MHTMLSSTIYAASVDNDVTSDNIFKMPKPKKRRKRRKRRSATVPAKTPPTSAPSRESSSTLSVPTVSSTTTTTNASTCMSTTSRRRTVNKERRYFQHDNREVVKAVTENELNYVAVARKFKPLTPLHRNRAQKQKKITKTWHKQLLKFPKRQQQQPKMLSKLLAPDCSSSTSLHSYCNCACNATATAAATTTTTTLHTKHKRQKSNNYESSTFHNKQNSMELQQKHQQSVAVESALLVEELLRKLLNAQRNNANVATSIPSVSNLVQHSGITSVSAPQVPLLDSLLGEHFQHTTRLCQQQLRHVVSVRETHQIAEAQQEKNAKLREAFNISEYFVEGSSFDSDRKAKEDIAKSLALQKELDSQRESAASSRDKEKEHGDKRRYALVRSPSREKDNAVSGGNKDDSDNEAYEQHVSKSEKKKKKKRTRESSASPERKRDKKKKSKKHKKESKSKKKKSRKRKSSESDSGDSDHASENEKPSSDSEYELKKQQRKRTKKDKQKSKKYIIT